MLVLGGVQFFKMTFGILFMLFSPKFEQFHFFYPFIQLLQLSNNIGVDLFFDALHAAVEQFCILVVGICELCLNVLVHLRCERRELLRMVLQVLVQIPSEILVLFIISLFDQVYNFSIFTLDIILYLAKAILDVDSQPFDHAIKVLLLYCQVVLHIFVDDLGLLIDFLDHDCLYGLFGDFWPFKDDCVLLDCLL